MYSFTNTYLSLCSLKRLLKRNERGSQLKPKHFMSWSRPMRVISDVIWWWFFFFWYFDPLYSRETRLTSDEKKVVRNKTQIKNFKSIKRIQNPLSPCIIYINIYIQFNLVITLLQYAKFACICRHICFKNIFYISRF